MQQTFLLQIYTQKLAVTIKMFVFHRTINKWEIQQSKWCEQLFHYIVVCTVYKEDTISLPY